MTDLITAEEATKLLTREGDYTDQTLDCASENLARTVIALHAQLADTDGLALVRELRAEIASSNKLLTNEARASLERLERAETAEAERDRLAAANAVLEAKVAGLELIKAAYEELVATVRGECPSLINDDSGGSQVLINLVIEADAALATQEVGNG
jgi:hypothetical protein